MLLSNTFLGQKLQILQLSTKNIIHVGKNDLFSDKEPKNITNDIIQLAESVKTDANKKAVSNILSKKDKFNIKFEWV